MAAMGAIDVNAGRRRTRTLQVGVVVVAIGVAVMAIRSAPTTTEPVSSATVETVPVAASSAIAPVQGVVSAASARVADATPRTPLGGPTIKDSPTRATAFDGTAGVVVISRAAIDALRHGEYLVSAYGDARIAHRVHRKEQRDDHTYVAMEEVDPVSGNPTGTYASYHLYEDSVTHYVNSEKVGYEVHGPLDAGIAFTNLRRPLSPEELAQIEREPAQRH